MMKMLLDTTDIIRTIFTKENETKRNKHHRIYSGNHSPEVVTDSKSTLYFLVHRIHGRHNYDLVTHTEITQTT